MCHTFIHLFVHLFVYLFIGLFIYLFIYLAVHSSPQRERGLVWQSSIHSGCLEADASQAARLCHARV